MLFANVTTNLWLATAHLKNPNITTSQFNDWYNTQLMPLFMRNHNASLGVRYKFLGTRNQTVPKYEYAALYKTHEDLNATHNADLEVLNLWRTAGRQLGKREIGPDDVAIELSTWRPIQTFEGLRERKGDVPAGRPKVACIVRLEPKAGLEGEKDVEEWYRYQHLDMMSMLPNYRRSTRYRSFDGSKPSYLAVHELDSDYVEPYLGEVLMGTEMTRKVMDNIQLFDAANWELIYEAGDKSEKL